MPLITFIQPNGTVRIVDANVGTSVMEAAVRNDVRGILAECRGACACATCHVYVDPAWQDAVGPSGEVEKTMLEFTEGAAENSRLSCQIQVTKALDGLVVTVPELQG